MHITTHKRYRCYYHPRPDHLAETGVLPFVQLRAGGADVAAQLAFAVTGKPIDRVERLEVEAMQ
jgi:hypothetical protein